jgi:hypothetical protein
MFDTNLSQELFEIHFSNATAYGRIRNPVIFLNPGTGIEKNRNRDEHPESYFRGLSKKFLGWKYLNIFHFSVADPDPGYSAFLTLDAGSGKEKSDPGLNIPDPQHYHF